MYTGRWVRNVWGGTPDVWGYVLFSLLTPQSSTDVVSVRFFSTVSSSSPEFQMPTTGLHTLSPHEGLLTIGTMLGTSLSALGFREGLPLVMWRRASLVYISYWQLLSNSWVYVSCPRWSELELNVVHERSKNGTTLGRNPRRCLGLWCNKSRMFSIPGYVW